MKSVVFLGPSMPWEEAKKELPSAEYRPPAGRGDIAAAVGKGFVAIGLIDGVFYQRPAVAPREIILAIENGITVVGGSSMGALRASELDSCGMVGVGKIYGWYKDGIINSDDEVALIFNPETLQPISEPLVNIRATLERLLQKGTISSSEQLIILEAAKGTPFQLRNYMRVIQSAMNHGLERERASAILDLMRSQHVDQKRLDAMAVLLKIKELTPD
jgi:hypothetical protein